MRVHHVSRLPAEATDLDEDALDELPAG